MNIKTYIKIFFYNILIVATFLFLIVANNASAAVSLLWSTTFNCAEWTQSNGLYNVNCDNLTGWGNWTCSGGEEDQITTNANNPGGGGGKGQRHWSGDGQNNNSGGLRLAFTSPPTELWMRWYMRYEIGYQWNPLQYVKIVYFDAGMLQGEFYAGFYSSDDLTMRVYASAAQNYKAGTGNGWQTIMGGSTSDGQWHSYEIHVKQDTNGSNGIAEMWTDGIKRLSYNNADFGTPSTGWTNVLIGSNQYNPNNGRCMYVDFDDISVSTTGYIGPISSGATDTTPPSAPSGLMVN